MDRSARIYVAGHAGMVGSAIVRRLRADGFPGVLTCSRTELDLLDQAATYGFLADARPDFVVVAAARVGGIQANHTRPADFVYENLAISANLIHGAHRADVRRLLYLGSSCAYPRDCPQPIREEYLLTGPLEPSNAPYAVAKIAGITLCDSYRRQYGRGYFSAMPTNLFGPNDNYDLASSHVLPALIRKTVEAVRSGVDELVVWGSGEPRREFLHVDDLAEACVFLMRQPLESLPPLINIGSGSDLSIRQLAELVMEVAGFRGRLRFDTGRPDGTPRKLLDTGRLNRMGWRPRIALRDGISEVLEDYRRATADA